MSESSHKKEKQTTEEVKIDDALVARAQKGEIEAFDELVLRHNKRLFGLLYHMTKDREDSYDLLQDVFAKAYRSINKFQGKSSFYTWIHSIGVNMTINHLKKRKRRQAYSLDDEDNGIAIRTAMPATGHQADPRREADLQVLKKKMNEALAQLSEQHRTVVVLYDLQGVPQAQISDILGISEGTVRSRLFYAHKRLQAELEDIKNQL